MSLFFILLALQFFNKYLSKVVSFVQPRLSICTNNWDTLEFQPKLDTLYFTYYWLICLTVNVFQNALLYKNDRSIFTTTRSLIVCSLNTEIFNIFHWKIVYSENYIFLTLFAFFIFYRPLFIGYYIINYQLNV